MRDALAAEGPLTVEGRERAAREHTQRKWESDRENMDKKGLRRASTRAPHVEKRWTKPVTVTCVQTGLSRVEWSRG